MIAHLAGSPARGALWPRLHLEGFVALLVGLLALLLFQRPRSRLLLRSVLGLAILLLGIEMPYAGNHWLLANAVGLLLLAATLRRGRAGGGHAADASWFQSRFAAGGRAVVVAFYAWTVIHKLNRDFLDPAVSCGLVHFNQSLEAISLPPLLPSSGFAPLVPAVVLGTEAVVLLLLLLPRLRPLGALLGFVFHILLSFDLGQHFFDFTAVMLPLFGLFLPVRTLAAWERSFPKLSTPLFWAAGLAIVVASVLPADDVTWWVLRRFVFVVWVPFALWFLWRAALGVRPLLRRGAWLASQPLAPSSAWAGLVLAGVLLNGAAPYVELKNGISWNMYSNLRSAAGRSNHLFLPTVSWFGAYDDPLVVERTSGRALGWWVDSGRALSRPRLLDYLTRRPRLEVELRGLDSGQVVVGSGADLGARLPLWRRKLLPVRPLDLEPRARCLTSLSVPY